MQNSGADQAKRILLCVCGGIAAYKTPSLVRRFRERGADVQVVMTDNAHQFIGETALQAVSARTVRHSLWDSNAEAAMGHIELARWADCIVIAPATANTLAKLAWGMADDLVTTLCLASTAPLHIAPAMNHRMWLHAATQSNVQTLKSRGAQIVGPDNGDMACGEHGPGRMVEPETLVDAVMGASR